MDDVARLCLPRSCLLCSVLAVLVLAPVGGRSEAQAKDDPGGQEIAREAPSGGVISGRVTDEQGQPLAGAEVSVTFPGQKLETRSADDGRFVFRGVNPGNRRLVVEKQGYGPIQTDPIVVGEKPVTGLVLQLRRGASLWGRVSGLEHEPSSRSRVSAHSHGRFRARYSPIDSEGRYSISDLSPGSWQVTAQNMDTRRSVERTVVIETHDSEVHLDLDFDQGYALSGMVVRNGTPLPSVFAELSCAEPLGRSWTRARSREDGSFRLRGVGRCELILDEPAPSRLRHRRPLEIDGDQKLRISYDATSVSGQVRNSESQPIAGTTLSLERKDPESGHFSATHTATDAEGFFHFDQLPEGSWQLGAGERGYERVSIPLELRSEQPIEDLLIEMAPLRETVSSPDS